MKKWIVLPCILLLAALTVAQTASPVPAGTALMVKLETTLATFSNKPGDQFRGQLTQPISLDGKILIPAGAAIEGRVTKVSEPRRISGKPIILPTRHVINLGLAVLLVAFAGLSPPAHGARHGLTPFLIVQAVVFGALGLLLLLAPDIGAAYWPWTLPPVLGQVYAAFLLTFSVGAAQAARETAPRAIRDFLIASLGLTVLVLLVSAVHLDRFKPEPVTGVWFAAFGLGAVAFAIGLIVQGRAMGWRRDVHTLAQQ